MRKWIGGIKFQNIEEKMKLVNYILIYIITIILFSCSEKNYAENDNQIPYNKNSIGINCIDCGNDLGSHHNKMMQIINNNLPTFDTNATKYDIINYVSNSIRTYLIDSLNYNLSLIDTIDSLMFTSGILNTAYPDNPIGYPLNVDWYQFSINSLNILKSYNDTNKNIYLLTDREYTFILNAFQNIFENPVYLTSDYLTTYSIMLQTINNYVIEWNNIQWNKNEGIFACIFLSQSKASTIFCRDYDYGSDVANYLNGPEAVAQVAADVGGAIVGAALGAAGSYISQGKVAWGTVGASAFAGAVQSTFPGLGGKVGATLLGWAKKLIK
ncbi:MAG: hypothetical protein QXM75_02645 [Candidatus Diapherotrites archaeon]